MFSSPRSKKCSGQHPNLANVCRAVTFYSKKVFMKSRGSSSIPGCDPTARYLASDHSYIIFWQKPRYQNWRQREEQNLRTEWTEVSLGMIWGNRSKGNAHGQKLKPLGRAKKIGEGQKINWILFSTREYVGGLNVEPQTTKSQVRGSCEICLRTTVGK